MELNEIKGIGEKNIKLLNKLKIYTLEDLITHYPRKYEIIKKSDLSNLEDEQKVITDGYIENIPLTNKNKYSFRISNNFGIYNINVFNMKRLINNLKIGDNVIIIGKYNKYYNTITASSIRLGTITKTEIEVIYPKTEGLSDNIIHKFIINALSLNYNINDLIPQKYIDKYKFIPKIEAIREIHTPTSTTKFNEAAKRIKYEEFFDYLYNLKKLRKNIDNSKAIARQINDDKLNDFINTLPFKLTDAQNNAVKEIKEDLLSKKRMNRLVIGDVGSGKTIIAFISMYINYLAGYQSVFMAPTEILARQHYENALNIYKNLNISFITSSVSLSKKKQIYEELEQGKIDILIGTQSLLSDNIKFANLGLVITDEEHRFGVNERDSLKNKGICPDVLSMSATPIPRTYALTIYGDVDITEIKAKPKGRLEIITKVLMKNNVKEILTMMLKEIKLGHQIYVIAPSIDTETEKSSVIELEENMKKAFSKIANIGIVHGKMKQKDKDNIMNNFKEGNIQILISTTIIEVGVNVPNASMIVIMDANMFGLSTLHQLRGRVGRGNIQSYCLLVSKISCERLNILEKCSDGFKISEYDFKTRGEGDLLGSKQSGFKDFKLADIVKDFKLLEQVKKDVDGY